MMVGEPTSRIMMDLTVSIMPTIHWHLGMLQSFFRHGDTPGTGSESSNFNFDFFYPHARARGEQKPSRTCHEALAAFCDTVARENMDDDGRRIDVSHGSHRLHNTSYLRTTLGYPAEPLSTAAMPERSKDDLARHNLLSQRAAFSRTSKRFGQRDRRLRSTSSVPRSSRKND